MLCVCDQTKYIKHVHDEKCMKQFHFMCIHNLVFVFIFKYIFFKNRVGVFVWLVLSCRLLYAIKISSLKHLYKTVLFGLYIQYLTK